MTKYTSIGIDPELMEEIQEHIEGTNYRSAREFVLQLIYDEVDKGKKLKRMTKGGIKEKRLLLRE